MNSPENFYRKKVALPSDWPLHGKQLEHVSLAIADAYKVRLRRCFSREAQCLDAVQPLDAFLVLERAFLVRRQCAECLVITDPIALREQAQWQSLRRNRQGAMTDDAPPRIR